MDWRAGIVGLMSELSKKYQVIPLRGQQQCVVDGRSLFGDLKQRMHRSKLFSDVSMSLESQTLDPKESVAACAQVHVASLSSARSAAERARLSRQRKKTADPRELCAPASNAERQRKWYKAQKEKKLQSAHETSGSTRDEAHSEQPEASTSATLEHIQQETSHQVQRQPYLNATREFHRAFEQQDFGHVCSVCDRLWFRNDVRDANPRHHSTLEVIGLMSASIKLCATCADSLARGKIPSLASYNGFRYPPMPTNLPKLNAITTRLVSPRIPFMQIRRLRRDTGTYSILGQIINVPVDVQTMVSNLPRHLNDDYAFNVSLKKHIIHKTAAYSGQVKKSEVKAWLDYLQTTPLYRLYNIKIDWSRFDHQQQDTEQEEIENITSDNDGELLISRQQTLLWNEDKYLMIAPGQTARPLSIIYDEHAEELSFPQIYFGVARRFRLGFKPTPFQIVTSEIRRSDRRGCTPEHILYQAVKIMRLRVASGLHATYRFSGDLSRITRQMIEDKQFVEHCVENNFAFLKSIPNSVQYWMSRKKDLFAMIRQLGKPTFFLTMSANEMRWPHLLSILHKIRTGNPSDVEHPLQQFSAMYRSDLVNNDSVTCCIYFWKMMSTIMRILQSAKNSPFGLHAVIDYFLRVEFQHRGSPHVHVLLWLHNDPKETVAEHMPRTVAMINQLCSVDLHRDVQNSYYSSVQVHKHTFTCYKNDKKATGTKSCRFHIPYWPSLETRILVPMAKEDGRLTAYRKKAKEIKIVLEEQRYETIDDFLTHCNISDEQYLDIIRASITRPTVLFKRNMDEIWTNTFNPWIANVLKSNMDFQFILEEYSCATYVVDYINKSQRGMSNLQQQLTDIQNEYPDGDYTELLKRLSIRMLDTIEITTQESAWYLLRQPMSEASREIVFITADVPNKRMICHKTRSRMESESITQDSTDVWAQNIIEKYECRPTTLSTMCLADFGAKMTAVRGKRDNEGHQIYRERNIKRIIRWTRYDPTDQLNYKRSMVLLFHPFTNEHNDLLDNDKFLSLYEANEITIHQRRQQYEMYQDFEQRLSEYHDQWNDIASDDLTQHEQTTCYTHEHDDLAQEQNDDIRQLPFPNSLSAVIKKRTNVISSADYCDMMRQTNFGQRSLIKHCIARIHDPTMTPIQIFFTGPAGSGKTFTLRLLMETFNRFAQTHDAQRNVYVAAASTGKAAVAIGGTTVHNAFNISTMQRHGGLTFEALQLYRCAFSNIRVIFIDEISMIGAGIFHTINDRLKNIKMEHDYPFGEMDIIFCGDLRQLPPVSATPIYEPLKRGIHRSVLWQSLKYYPLKQIMRQSDLLFSNILTKIGNGDALDPDQKALIESRFRSRDWCHKNVPNAIRLFHKNVDVDTYNASTANPRCHSIASDAYTGHRDQAQLNTARTHTHKMSIVKSGNMPYNLPLCLEQPYMITTNVNIEDGIVNGAIGQLKHIDFKSATEPDADDPTPTNSTTTPIVVDGVPYCLWLEFQENTRIGNMARVKHRPMLITRKELRQTWTPIFKKTTTFPVSNNKTIKCRRTNFPLCQASAITTHKSQGATFDHVVFDYNRGLQQQLVYVALSRVRTIEGLFMTNPNNDFKFHHAKPATSPMLLSLQNELRRLTTHPLITIDHLAQLEMEKHTTILLNFNVQSLAAHVRDITTDTILMQATIYCLTETWLKNEHEIAIPGLQLMSQNKRPVRAGGVAIYVRTNSAPQDALRQQPQLTSDDCGDICSACTTIDGNLTQIVCIYINTSTSIEDIKNFLLKHTAIIGSTTHENHERPLILAGDFNCDMRIATNKMVLTAFMKHRFNLDLITNTDKPTTKNNTCIDLTFTRKVPHGPIFTNISYFSYHHPSILCLQ